MTKKLENYITLSRKTMVVPQSIMKLLLKVEGKLSWRDQRIAYGRIFALGILARDILTDEDEQEVIDALEDNQDHMQAASIFYSRLTGEKK